MAPMAEHQQEQSSSKQRLPEEVTASRLTVHTARDISNGNCLAVTHAAGEHTQDSWVSCGHTFPNP